MKLDHCVLPTASVDAARERLTRLGFTVAPDAAHPFGTANCCVFFEDGTYLEPLAVAEENAARQAIATGNVFVERDRMFRQACGGEGFSALALGTEDAALDHARFVGECISAGRLLSFSRPFTDSDGVRTEASFQLAFAASPSSPSYFFTCQRVNPPAVGAPLRRHENGAVGILRIIATAAEPEAEEPFLNRLFRTDSSQGIGIWPLSSAAISLYGPEAAKDWIGVSDDRRLRLRAIVLGTLYIDRLIDRLDVAGIVYKVHRDRVVVPPAPGQGACLIFEDVGVSAFELVADVLLGPP